MDKKITGFPDFFIGKRLHTGILAVTTAIFSMRCIGITLNDPWVLAASFLLVWSGYLENITTDQKEDQVNNARPLPAGHFAIERISPLTYALGVICASFSGVLCFFMALIFAALSLGYNRCWVFAGPGRRIRLKQVFLIKNIVPPAAWVLAVAVLPFLHSGASPRYEYLPLLFLIFLFGVREEIKFDIPDVEGDRAAGVRTLPGVIGEQGTKNILGFLSGILVMVLFGSMLILHEAGLDSVQKPLIENILPFLVAFSYDRPFVDLLYVTRDKTRCDLGILWWIFLLGTFLALPFPLNILIFILLRVAGGKARS